MDPFSDKSSKRDLEENILLVIQEFLTTLGNEVALRALNRHAALDKSLGLGSLERVELVFRLEKTLGVQLPERLLYESETVEDLINAIRHAHPLELPISSFAPTPALPMHNIDAIILTAQTLVEVLQHYAISNPHRTHIYLQSETGAEQLISYSQLFETASTCAYGLTQLGIQFGDKVAIMLPTSKAFFYAFFAVLIAGGVPVPVYPPVRAQQIEAYTKRQAAILHNAQVKILITERNIESLAHLIKYSVPKLTHIVNLVELMKYHGTPSPVQLVQTDPALIQYTSGSTGDPKGVLLTHQNLLANIRAIGAAVQIKPKDVGVSWLPLYHDMGLIGSWLSSLYFGLPFVVMSPLIFLTRPERWLWAIHYHRGSLSAAPNFAYELCVRKIEDKMIEGLDLSSWRIAFNGAEPINPATVERFIQRFSPYGFRAEALTPVYGLAESCVGLTFPPLGRKFQVDRINRDIFISTGHAMPATQQDNSPLQFVACGMPLPGHEIRIMDDTLGKILPERMEGQLQFRGPSSMMGYFNACEATQNIFNEDGWLNTGDFAYIANHELYITGRKKDVIIKAGRNYYPQEIENIVAEIAGIRKGCVAAFGIADPILATEKIVVVAEVKENHAAHRHPQIKAEITQLMVNTLGVPADVLILTRPQTIPKTSSGKLCRSQCKSLYLAGRLLLQPESVRKQIAKIWLRGIKQKIQNAVNKLLSFIYTLYTFLVLIITAFPVWVLTLLLPGSISKRFMQGWARIFLMLIACPLRVCGLKNVPKKPCIFIANHASYLDVIVLLAALPSRAIAFVAKQELTQLWFLRSFLKKHKHLLVNRCDFAGAETETQLIENILRQGTSVIIFPEGTFTYTAGIRPFKLGAFKISVATSTAICPVAIQGTRKIFPSDQWLLRPQRVQVILSSALIPNTKDFDEIIRLRDKARDEIARNTGESALYLSAAGIDT